MIGRAMKMSLRARLKRKGELHLLDRQRRDTSRWLGLFSCVNIKDSILTSGNSGYSWRF